MLTDQELERVLVKVAEGMGLAKAIEAEGKQLNESMRDWFIPNPRDAAFTQHHRAYLVMKKGSV